MNTAVIYCYHKDILIEILNNLEVYDQVGKQTYRKIVDYTIVKHSSIKSTIYEFIITAHQVPTISFIEIGKQIERKIDGPIRNSMPISVGTYNNEIESQHKEILENTPKHNKNNPH